MRDLYPVRPGIEVCDREEAAVVGSVGTAKVGVGLRNVNDHRGHHTMGGIGNRSENRAFQRLAKRRSERQKRRYRRVQCNFRKPPALPPVNRVDLWISRIPSKFIRTKGL